MTIAEPVLQLIDVRVDVRRGPNVIDELSLALRPGEIVCLVGESGSGKSTLMNCLSKSVNFVENKLFATLDTTTRKVVLGQTPFLLSDTVGFIRKLPHHLVESFKSTLDEVREADLLIHVVDMSHPEYEEQIQVVQHTLQDLGAGEKPTLLVFNKLDKYEAQTFDPWLEAPVREELLQQVKKYWSQHSTYPVLLVSALEKQHLETLREVVLQVVQDLYASRYPYRTTYYK